MSDVQAVLVMVLQENRTNNIYILYIMRKREKKKWRLIYYEELAKIIKDTKSHLKAKGLGKLVVQFLSECEGLEIREDNVEGNCK